MKYVNIRESEYDNYYFYNDIVISVNTSSFTIDDNMNTLYNWIKHIVWMTLNDRLRTTKDVYFMELLFVVLTNMCFSRFKLRFGIRCCMASAKAVLCYRGLFFFEPLTYILMFIVSYKCLGISSGSVSWSVSRYWHR